VASRDIGPVTIPDDFTVWVGSDLHGQRRAVQAALLEAGLIDADGRWSAAPRTALVVCGDIVDRGPDSVGLVRLLARLRDEAAASDGIVALLEGNHEVQALGGLDGEPTIWRAFMAFGGGATLLSAGLEPGAWSDGATGDDVGRRVAEVAPDFVPLLWSFAPYARWGDVMFVHAGPIPGRASLDAFERHADRLWIRGGFFASTDSFPDAPAWATYRDAGIRRVVFGHTPVTEPTLAHDGRALNVDTWRGERVTLARLAPGAALAEATFVSAPTEPRTIADDPVTADQIRELDQGLPAVVDAWMDAREGRTDRLGARSDR
jgi:serine/threonine protein phosphatase 1